MDGLDSQGIGTAGKKGTVLVDRVLVDRVLVDRVLVDRAREPSRIESELWTRAYRFAVPTAQRLRRSHVVVEESTAEPAQPLVPAA